MRWSVTVRIVQTCATISASSMRVTRFEVQTSRSLEARSSQAVESAEFEFPAGLLSLVSKSTKSKRSQTPRQRADCFEYAAQVEHSKVPLQNSCRKVVPGCSH